MRPEEVDCPYKCSKILDCGHVCPKLCKQACGPCLTLVDKRLSVCGHLVQVPCYYAPSRMDCKQRCSRILKCGHPCKQMCSDIDCESTPCEDYVNPSVGSCGHLMTRKCYEKTQGLLFEFVWCTYCNYLGKCLVGILFDFVDKSKCTQACNTKLVCGHVCSGTCGTCHQGRFHVPCRKSCERKLICGHM